jgi:long-chain acyl-CoA synthetase
MIVPNFDSLEHYAQIKKLEISSRAEMLSHPRIINLMERQIAEYTAGIGQFEKVKKIALLENELTVEGGELTPTLKVRRKIVDEKYHDLIESIYSHVENKKP